MADKLIIDANYDPYKKDNPLQVQIGDGSNQAKVNDNGSLRTENFDSFSLMNGILKELKIMNLHLSLMTDTEIKHIEVE